MYKTVIENSELEKWRSIREMNDFIESIISRIRVVYDKERTNYHLSKGNYKNFNEEYVPMFHYLKNKYGLVENVQYRHFGVKNESYDGEIKQNNIIIRIEIGYPLLGKAYKARKQKMLDNGASLHEYGEELFPKIRQVILDTAIKKAKKPYREILLIIYYSFFEQLYPGDTGLTEVTFNKMINELRAISYVANRVDFFVPAFKSVLVKQCKPERVYKIK